MLIPPSSVPKNAPEPWNISSSESRFSIEFLVQAGAQLQTWLAQHAAVLSAGFGLVGIVLVTLTWFTFQNALQTSATTLNTTSETLLSITPSVQGMSTPLSTQSGKIRAHIAGAVRKPGVYELSAASVVQDLVTQAGGLSGLVWQDYLDAYINLAAPLVANQKVWIPTETQRDLLQRSKANLIAGDALQTTEEQGTGSASTIGELLSINTASVAELDTLAGIGQKRAEDIAANRPYVTFEELTSKAGVPASIVSKLQTQLKL